ncbi:MAG: biotin--[Treponema sp.]|nr:biotin--[acetyl-CoA-carboxylase] ligase [Treponema sp.]
MNLIHLKTIDSTNAEALRLLCAAQNVRELDQTVIAADEQSAGRGRLKRAFYSPANTGLYFTAIYAPKKPIDDPALLTACAAVAACRGLKEFFGVEAKIKWVNDLYLNGKKVCGILAEGHLGPDGLIDAAAIGIGINIYPSDFPVEISGRAGAVLQAQESGVMSFPRLTRESFAQKDVRVKPEHDTLPLNLARDISQKLFEILNDPSLAEEALKEYADLSFIVGKEITVTPIIGDDRSAYPATVLGIDKKARLLVRLLDGSERALSSGEISIKI